MRKGCIDFLRIFASLAVVLIHILTGSASYHETVTGITAPDWTVIVHDFLYWAVPVFFMITGYCICSKEECTYKYCFKHIKKYVIMLFTVGLLFAILELIFDKGSFSFSLLTEAILNIINGKSWAHMWFIYAIIGVYLVLPVIHKFMRTKENYILVILLFIFTILLPQINDLLGTSIDIYFPFGNFIFYVCFGALIANIKLDKIPTILISVGCLLIWIGSIVDDPFRKVGYYNIFVCLSAVAIFMLFCLIDYNSSRFVSVMADCSWGVYIIHPVIINFVLKFLKLDMLASYGVLKTILFYIVTTVISFVGIYIIRKIPILKKIF